MGVVRWWPAMTRSSRRKGPGSERPGVHGIDARIFVLGALLGAALLGLAIGVFVRIVRRPWREIGVAIMLFVGLSVVAVACRKRRDPRAILPVIFAAVWDPSVHDEIQTADWASAEGASAVVAIAVPEPVGIRAEWASPPALPSHLES